jgi:hypothetical protein
MHSDLALQRFAALALLLERAKGYAGRDVLMIFAPVCRRRNLLRT